MKVAVITAGGAGMFCGSCMQDNTLCRTLRQVDVDAVLVPTYTPIRVEEEDLSGDRVFLGGINVYLDSVIPGWKRLPGWMTSWLNRPSIIRSLSRFGSTDAAKLGALTLDMLKGDTGPQQREFDEFTDYICDELKPEIIVFSNALLSGLLSRLRPRFSGRILCLLQGDDIFLEGLTDRWKTRVLDQLEENCTLFDGFLTHSQYYLEFMSQYLSVPKDRFRKIPLTIDVDSVGKFQEQTALSETSHDHFRIGYFARICPEKGIQNLLEAARMLLPSMPHAELIIAGYLDRQNRKWFENLLQQTQAVVPGRIRWLGSPASRSEKLDVIRQFDVMCVPTEYHEPKGLYVLEAGLMGVPSLVPNHGAFPELIATLGFGSLYSAGDIDSLLEGLKRAKKTPGSADFAQIVSRNFSMQQTARALKTAITQD